MPLEGMDPQLKEFRQHLILAAQDAQRSFDQALFALASAGLGISFALVGSNDALLAKGVSATLLGTWVSWGSSLIVGLASHVFSKKANNKSIKQVNAGTIYNDKRPGGWWSIAVDVSNYLTALLFLAGVVLFALFLSQTLGGK